MKLIYKINWYITFLVILCCSTILSVNAQVTKTVGTRITDNLVEKQLKNNAILDLESTSKGFFLPRMTTVQRDAIKKEMGHDNGLAIYNIDIDCVEYWSERTQKWMSLCGSLPPANLDLAPNSCSSIVFSGFTMIGNQPQVQQGTPLDPQKHFMSIKLKVNQVGTYNISVNSDNGYFFSGEGQFQAIGTYDITLKAMGTPIKGYDGKDGKKGDILKFTINGIESSICTNTEILVLPADLEFKILNNTYKASGKYNVGVSASAETKGNKIELNIDVKSKGTATVVATNEILDIQFIGTQELNVGDKTMTLEPVFTRAIPKQNDLSSYDLALTVNTKDPIGTINSNKVTLIVEQTEIKADFDNINLGLEPFFKGSALNDKHTIVLPIKVINSGISNLYLKGAGGVVFKAENVNLQMPVNPDEMQEVEFKAELGSKLPDSDAITLTLSGDGKRFQIVQGTSYDLQLSAKPVEYSIDCMSVKSNRGAIPYNSPIGETYFITATVDVKEIGEYEVSTSMPIEGITFTTTRKGVKQKFTKTGKQVITLYADNPLLKVSNRGNYQVNLISNDGSDVKCMGFTIKVGYNDIKVLIIKGDYEVTGYTPTEDRFFTGKNKSGKYRFGEEGEYVETGSVSVTIFDVKASTNTSGSRSNLARDIKAKKYNFIMFSGRYAIFGIDKQIADALYDYTVNDDGIFWLQTGYYGDERPGASVMYVDEMNNERYSSSFSNTFLDGMNLVKRFNNNNDLKAGVDARDYAAFNAQVVSEKDPLTSPKKGFSYIKKSNGVYYQVEWTHGSSTKSGVNAVGTEYEAIVADRGKQEYGTVFKHKKYSNLIWAPISSYHSGSVICYPMQADEANAEPLKKDFNGQYGAESNAGAFAANIFIELVSRLANR